MKVARHVGRLEGKRPPKLVKGAVEGATGRENAHHGVWLIVQKNGAVEDRGVAAETILPQHIGEQNHMFFAELIFVGKERAADNGLDAEDIEIAGGNKAA